MAMNNLRDVMVDMVKDLYHAEKQLVKALPKMAKAATSEDLKEAFESHLEETEGHVRRLEQVFAALEMKPIAKTCHGMMGLVEEGKEVIEEQDDDNEAAIDAALIAAAQKVEHYEITAYGTLATFAETLQLTDVLELLKETLSEEEAADEKLSDLAEGGINEDAAQASADEGTEDEGEMPTRETPAKGGKKSGPGSGGRRGTSGSAKPSRLSGSGRNR
jgi:ferritin-like metal-binding protein YciE